MKGNCLIGFNTSRDVVEVRHVTSREPWISHGSGHDSYGHQVRLDCSPLRTGDEDWLYGTVVNGDHGVGRGGYGPRTPVGVTGKTLQMNVDASRGDFKVAIVIDKQLQRKKGAGRSRPGCRTG